MSPTEEPPSPRLVAWILWVGHIVLAGVATFFVWFRAISTPHCAPNCDFALLYNSTITFAWVAFTLVTAVAVALVLARSRPSQWMFPIAGMVLTLIGALVANYLSDIALRFV